MESGDSSLSQRIGLYYPYLHFPEDSWLKIAALYWPRMARIVPPNFPLSDTETVHALSAELDFTLNVSPEGAASKLTEVLINAIHLHKDAFIARYAVSPYATFIGSSHCAPSWPRPRELAEDWRNYSTKVLDAACVVVGLHSGKGEYELWELLYESGLAVRRGDWWGLHPEFAWLYMCVLADKLARQNRLVPTTDEDRVHVESLGWTNEAFVSALLGEKARTDEGPSGWFASRIGLLALNIVVPADLDSIPIATIIKIRQRYGADFDAFHRDVANMGSPRHSGTGV